MLPLEVTPRYSGNDHRAGMAADLTGWEDLQGSIQQGAGVSALTTEAYRDTPLLMSFFRSGQVDKLSFIYQMSHRWQPGTKVRPHLHVVPMADPASTQNVLIEGQYAWMNDSTALPANSGWTTFSVVVPVNPGDAFKEKIVDFTGGVGITPPASFQESDLLCIYIQRTGNSGSDTYNTAKSGGTAAANLGLLSADVHFQCQKVGTQLELLG